MRRLTDERGGVAVVVTLSMVVMLGAAALVVDVGRLHAEKRELQNGADAAVLAMAEDCAFDRAACGSIAAARTWLESNATDGFARVIDLDVDADDREVYVRAGTLDAEGHPYVPMTFATVLGISRRDVRASATAGWGAPRTFPHRSDGTPYPSLPLTIDGCEYDSATDGGEVFGRRVVITFHRGGGGGGGDVPQPCAANASGQDRPGNFGWIDRTSDCQADIAEVGPIGGDTGNSPPHGCESEFRDRVGEEIVFPVFRTASGNGSHVTYRITGFAAFHVDGYKLGGSSAWEHPSSNPPCRGGDRCVSGWFTRVAVEAETGGEDFGATAVSLKRNAAARGNDEVVDEVADEPHEETEEQ